VVRHRWWSEYGGSAPDPYDIPAKIREAHLAILRGKDKKREKEQRKAESKANNAG